MEEGSSEDARTADSMLNTLVQHRTAAESKEWTRNEIGVIWVSQQIRTRKISVSFNQQGWLSTAYIGAEPIKRIHAMETRDHLGPLMPESLVWLEYTYP